MKNADFFKLIAHKVTERFKNDKDLKWCCHNLNLASFEQIFIDKVLTMIWIDAKFENHFPSLRVKKC